MELTYDSIIVEKGEPIPGKSNQTIKWENLKKQVDINIIIRMDDQLDENSKIVTPLSSTSSKITTLLNNSI